MTWRKEDLNMNTAWLHEPSHERLLIEVSEHEIEYSEQRDFHFCKNCGVDIDCCQCSELWVYSEDMGECDCVGTAKSESEAFKLAEDFMKKYPNGWFEKIGFQTPKVEFVFR